MNQIVINQTAIQVKEYNGKRVVTFKDIDTVHERPEGTARKRFNDNRKHFIEGEDYFIVKPSDNSLSQKEFQMSEKRTLEFDVQMSVFRTSEIQKDEIRPFEIPNRGLTLITETGYLMLVKSFTDDLAWIVQRQLVNTYFKARQEKIKEVQTNDAASGAYYLDITEKESLEQKLLDGILISAERVLAISEREAKELCAVAFQRKERLPFFPRLNWFKIKEINTSVGLQKKATYLSINILFKFSGNETYLLKITHDKKGDLWKEQLLHLTGFLAEID